MKRPSPEIVPPFKLRAQEAGQWHVLPEGTFILPRMVRPELNVQSFAVSDPPVAMVRRPVPLTSQESRVKNPPLRTENEPRLPKKSEPDNVDPEDEHVTAPLQLNKPPFDISMFPLTQLNELQVRVEPDSIKTGLAANEPKVMELTVIEEGIVSWQFVARTTSELAEGMTPPDHARGSPQFAFPVERRVMVADDTRGRRTHKTNAYDTRRIAQIYDTEFQRTDTGRKRLSVQIRRHTHTHSHTRDATKGS